MNRDELAALWAAAWLVVALWDLLEVRAALTLARRRQAWAAEHHMDAGRSSTRALASLAAASAPWLQADSPAFITAMVLPALVFGPLFYLHLTTRR